MICTYALAVETAHGIKPLPFGPLTLAQAEFWRDRMAAFNKPLYVINLNAI